MRPRYLVFITLLAVCHVQLGAQNSQLLTNAAPASPGKPGIAQESAAAATSQAAGWSRAAASSQAAANSVAPDLDALPDDPGQELVPEAQPEPAPPGGTPVRWEALRQEWVNNSLTLTGDVAIYYEDYVIRADKAVYNRTTTELNADGHLQVTGGPNDVFIKATHGDMRLNTHTGRFYNVTGSQGVRTMGHAMVYTTPTPLLFSGRVLLELGPGSFKIIDGSITNCRLPHPDWRVIAHAISLNDKNASTTNAFFEFLGMPIFYLPYLHHPVNETDRVSGFLVPEPSNSSIKGLVIGEQVYWAINRSMDAVIGSEYYSKRGWAPNGDFRYKGPGLDSLIARWNALLDRGIEGETGTTSTGQPIYGLINQGGVDVTVQGRKDFSPQTRLSGTMEYLSSYVYRLVFNDNYSTAISSQVASEVVLTHNRNGLIPSAWLDRFQSFDGTTNGDEVKILRLPLLRYDVLDRPLGSSWLYWGLGSSLGYLNRAEPYFHSRNVGRLDFYPHLSMPIVAGGWSFVPEVALRDTFYTISQVPMLTGPYQVPRISHKPLNRTDLQASIDIRPPALERDFELPFWHRELRHVIEPEFNYRYVGGIGAQARNVLLFDTTDIATDVNEAGFTLTQRFYVRPTGEQPCKQDGAEKTQSQENPKGTGKAQETKGSPDGSQPGGCPAPPREWATWQIAQEYFIDPDFGGALIPGRRNVFDATLDLMAPAFLTSPRNIAPIVSRMRFNAVNNLRVEWDFDYDTIRGEMAADNLFAGYSFGNTTVGIGHALLNAVDETPNGATSPVTIKSQQLQPFIEIGKPSGKGFNLAANGGYDFVAGDLQYGGVQAVYNWDCCGLMMGYKRYELGTVQGTGRNEHEWLYGFTLANFGTVGDIRRTNSVFRDPTLPPAY